VHAVCGAEFVPLRLADEEPIELPGYPPDPEQICPACARGGAPVTRSARLTNSAGPYSTSARRAFTGRRLCAGLHYVTEVWGNTGNAAPRGYAQRDATAAPSGP
jgi:hypothetical protein